MNRIAVKSAQKGDMPFERNTAYKWHSMKKYPRLLYKVAGKLFFDAREWEKMAKDANVSKVAAGAVLDSFMANVTKALKKKDGKVTLVGFGTFQKTRQKARKGRNPQTGEPLKIKARNVVKFKAGKKLKESV